MSQSQTFKVEYEGSPDLMYPPNDATVISGLTPNQVNYITMDAASGTDISRISFKINIPETSCMGKDVRVRCFFKALLTDITGIVPAAGAVPATTAQNIVDSFSDVAFAQTGLLQIVNTITVGHGSDTFVINQPQLITQCLLPTIDPAFSDQTLSDCQVKPDLLPIYKNYDQANSVTCVGVGQEQTDVYVKRTATTDVNIFSYFNGNQLYTSRVPNISIGTIDHANHTAEIYFSLTTFIPCSLFDGSMTNSNFNPFGINSFSLDLNLNPNFKKMFSAITAANFKLSNFSFANIPQIFCQTYTPKDYILHDSKDANGKFKDYLIPYTSYETNYTQIMPSDTAPKAKAVQVTVNGVKLTTLPKRLFIAVIPDREHSDAHLVPCTFARIESCVLNINGAQSLVNTNAEHLLNLSQRNSLQLDRTTAMYFSGFPLVLDLTKDVSCPSLIGENLGVDISMNLSFTNLAAVARKFKVVVVSEHDNVFKYENGTVKYMTTAVATNLMVSDPTEVTAKNRKITTGIYGGRRYGGGFFDSIGRIGKWVVDKGVPAALTAVNAYKTIKGGKSEVTGGRGSVKDSKFY